MDVPRGLEQLRIKRVWKDRDQEGAGGGSGDMSENEDAILLIPEGDAGVIAVASSSLMDLTAGYAR